MTDFDLRFALCRDVDPELFFPLGLPGSPGYERQAAPARAVCADCPIRAGCLAFALGAGLDDGIFGGLDPAQRRALRAGAAARRAVEAALARKAAQEAAWRAKAAARLAAAVEVTA